MRYVIRPLPRYVVAPPRTWFYLPKYLTGFKFVVAPRPPPLPKYPTENRLRVNDEVNTIGGTVMIRGIPVRIPVYRNGRVTELGERWARVQFMRRMGPAGEREIISQCYSFEVLKVVGRW